MIIKNNNKKSPNYPSLSFFGLHFIMHNGNMQGRRIFMKFIETFKISFHIPKKQKDFFPLSPIFAQSFEGNIHIVIRIWMENLKTI